MVLACSPAPPEAPIPPSLLLLAALAGCYGPHVVRSQTFERDIVQVGVIEAPTPPHDVGPQLLPGQVALTGAVEYSGTPPVDVTRAEGASGAILATGWARGMATFGVAPWMQLGLEAEISPADLARPLATDISQDGWSGPLLRGGFTARSHFQTGHMALEPFWEVEIAGARWYHTETITETDETFTAEGSTVDVKTSTSEDFRRAIYLTGRTGMGFAFGSPNKPQFRVGPYFGNAPWLYGDWSDT